MTERGQCWMSKKARSYRGQRANGIGTAPASRDAQFQRHVSMAAWEHLRFHPLALLLFLHGQWEGKLPITWMLTGQSSWWPVAVETELSDTRSDCSSVKILLKCQFKFNTGKTQTHRAGQQSSLCMHSNSLSINFKIRKEILKALWVASY